MSKVFYYGTPSATSGPSAVKVLLDWVVSQFISLGINAEYTGDSSTYGTFKITDWNGKNYSTSPSWSYGASLTDVELVIGDKSGEECAALFWGGVSDTVRRGGTNNQAPSCAWMIYSKPDATTFTTRKGMVWATSQSISRNMQSMFYGCNLTSNQGYSDILPDTFALYPLYLDYEKSYGFYMSPQYYTSAKNTRFKDSGGNTYVYCGGSIYVSE